jgi:lipoprotein-anchoring transpeptidase ErfK/SrfK
MAVLYGSYVSLTTPPEPLPAEIENMLVETGELDIEAGFPDSLESMISAPDANSAESNDVDPGQFTFADLTTGPAQPETQSPDNSLAMLGNANDQTRQESLPQPLPAATVEGHPAKVDLSRPYPATNSEYLTPDPISAAAAFDSSLGEAFASSASQTKASLTDKPVNVRQASAPVQKNQFALPDVELLAATSKTVGTTASVESTSRESDKNTSPTGSPNLGLLNAIQTADKQYKADQRKEALATLSLFYNTPNLTSSEREQLLARLDPLAGEVIYSRRHLLEQSHRVDRNETLMEVAARYDVPWQLLANINGIADPVTVLPGTELKVVRGPFRAEVNISTSELTLFLGDLYAGRFPIGVGSDPAPKEGTFSVQDKQTSKTFYDPSGSPVPAGSPANPYGTMWMDLGGRLSIHGSPDRTRPSPSGCISLAGDYAEDLFGILSLGSSVTIRR